MKIAFSGTHGIGKSWSVYSEALKLKAETPTKSIACIQELARENPFEINKTANDKGQMWVLVSQIQRELEWSEKNDILVCDRTVLDGLAYAQYLGMKNFITATYSLVENWIRTYDIIYFKKIKDNDFLFFDGVRDMDIEFRETVEVILEGFYDNLVKKNILFKHKDNNEYYPCPF